MTVSSGSPVNVLLKDAIRSALNANLRKKKKKLLHAFRCSRSSYKPIVVSLAPVVVWFTPLNPSNNRRAGSPKTPSEVVWKML